MIKILVFALIFFFSISKSILNSLSIYYNGTVTSLTLFYVILIWSSKYGNFGSNVITSSPSFKYALKKSVINPEAPSPNKTSYYDNSLSINLYEYNSIILSVSSF